MRYSIVGRVVNRWGIHWRVLSGSPKSPIDMVLSLMYYDLDWTVGWVQSLYPKVPPQIDEVGQFIPPRW